jgi:hypothetical protein
MKQQITKEIKSIKTKTNISSEDNSPSESNQLSQNSLKNEKKNIPVPGIVDLCSDLCFAEV